MANEQITIDVLAKDNASKVINKVADEAASLEKLSPEVVIAASDRASADLDKVLTRTESLDGDTAKVILEAEASRAEGAISNLQLLLGQVDGEQATAILAAKDQATGDLERIQSRMRALDGSTADVTVDVRTTGLDKLDQVAGALPGRLGDAAGALAQMGGGAAGAAAGVGAAAVAAYSLANNFADAAIEAQTLSTLTGATVEESSQLSQVWEQTGADTKDLADVMLQVNGALAQSPELAAQLGIEGENAQEVFQNAVEAVRGIQDPLEKARIGSQLFGEEGVRQVGAVLGITQDLNAEVAAREPLVTPEDARQAVAFKAAMTEVKAEVSKLAMEFGRNLLPQIQDSTEAFGTFMKVAGPTIGFFSELQTVLAPMGTIIDAVTGNTEGLLDRFASWPVVGGMVNDELERMKDAAREAGFAVDDNVGSMSELEASTSAQARAAADAGMTVDEYNESIGETGGEAGGAAVEIDKLTRSVGSLNDEIRGNIDPLFAMTDATASWAEAQANLATVQADSSATEAELAAAHQRVAETSLDVTTAANDLTRAIQNGTVNVGEAKAQLQTWVAQGLLTQAQADTLAGAMDGAADAAANLDSQAPYVTVDSNVKDQTQGFKDLDGWIGEVDGKVARTSVVVTVKDAKGSFFDPAAYGLPSLSRAAPPTGAETGAEGRAAPSGLGVAPMASTGLLAVSRAAPTIVINVDARGAPDPYAVGRAVAKSLNKWGSIGGQWLPGGRG